MVEHINAYITNLGKYNEGELVGQWVEFPTTQEEIIKVFKEIGIDGVEYEEFFISDYETNVDGLNDCLSEYTNLDELNYLASKLFELDEYNVKKLEAVLEHENCKSIEEVINISENLDAFDYIPDIKNKGDLGYYWLYDSGVYDLSTIGNLANYLDYEKFGRDIVLNESGTFTNNGYIYNCDSICIHYNGKDIPDEYKVTYNLTDELKIEHDNVIKNTYSTKKGR